MGFMGTTRVQITEEAEEDEESQIFPEESD
jgi:hypothetical protein